MRHPPDALYADVRDTDPDVLDADGPTAHVGRLAQLQAWLDAEKVRATRAQRRLADDGRAVPPEHSLARDGKTSSRDAKATTEREAVCTAMPGFEDALAVGAVSAGHVDAVASATKHLDEAETAEFVGEAESLLADAEKQGVDAFTRGCRELAKSIRARHHSRADVDELERQREQSKVTRWVDQTTGMHHTHIECDPLTDRQIWSAVQGARGTLRRSNQQTGTRCSWERLTVDAIVEAVSSTGAKARTGMVVHIDLPTLTDGRHDTTLCETDSGVSLPVDTMRRMACKADIIPVVLNGDGVVLDEGRAKRLATHEQRVAIEAMQATCSHPDCTVTIDDCRIHHLTPWRLGGRTDLADLAPVCETHHHLIHEGGWTLTMTEERVATWTRPDGHTYWTGSLNDRRPIAA
ncbi:HNH endonuclease [Ilumatobacter sp.]|uniref:HNH endonuclease signature motif containing protein n=1 Tax=Ilumatobacter sp. TaxID=1967498 RepID=UPI003AF5FE68